jgi:hypothetical protein
MDTQEKLAAIDRFERGGSAFDDLRYLDTAILVFRPFQGAWTIHEHVVHFLESDIASFHRYRSAVALPGSPVLGYDEEAWTPALAYHGHDFGETLLLIGLLRSYAAKHLRLIAGQDWKALAYVHSSKGRVDLEQWIEQYIDHVRFHRELIDRNLKAWEDRGGRG